MKPTYRGFVNAKSGLLYGRVRGTKADFDTAAKARAWVESVVGQARAAGVEVDTSGVLQLSSPVATAPRPAPAKAGLKFPPLSELIARCAKVRS